MRFSTLFTNILCVTALVLLPLCSFNSSPSPLSDRSLVYKRAMSLDNGVSVSWLEQIWDNNMLNKKSITASDFKLLKQLGFKSIRIPVAFAYFQANSDSLKKALYHIDRVLQLCDLYGFKLIICFHSGNLNDNNYAAETQKVIDIWRLISHKYISQSADNLFFELYNEPPHMNPDNWKKAANEMIAAVRKIDKKRTLIMGASNFNSIYEMSRMTPFADDNIIYTFHFYEPFLFTHQGAEWVGDQSSTTGIPFPYNAATYPPLNPEARNTPGESHYNLYPKDGNERSVHDKLQIIKNWAVKNNVPILCGEYGVYNKYADPDSRCRYIKAVRQNLKEMKIPGMLWDYNGSFSIFNGKPSLQRLSVCMKDAIGFNEKK